MVSTVILREDADKFALFYSQQAELEAELVFYNRTMVSHRTFIAAIEGEKVIGLVSILETSLRVPGAMAITYVVVRENNRNQGVAKLLIKALFDFAKNEGRAIANTQYEDDGQLYLRPLLEAAARNTPEVVFHEFPYNNL